MSELYSIVISLTVLTCAGVYIAGSLMKPATQTGAVISFLFILAMLVVLPTASEVSSRVDRFYVYALHFATFCAGCATILICHLVRMNLNFSSAR